MQTTWRRTIAKYPRAFITTAKLAMPFGDHSSLKSESDSVIFNFIAQLMLATLRRTITKYPRAYTIAKQAMPFGDHLSLKSESDFSTILALNMLATWR